MKKHSQIILCDLDLSVEKETLVQAYAAKTHTSEQSFTYAGMWKNHHREKHDSLIESKVEVQDSNTSETSLGKRKCQKQGSSRSWLNLSEVP